MKPPLLRCLLCRWERRSMALIEDAALRCEIGLLIQLLECSYALPTARIRHIDARRLLELRGEEAAKRVTTHSRDVLPFRLPFGSAPPFRERASVTGLVAVAQ